MGEIVKDKTAIFIFHRLSSCKLSDNILVFDKGNIVQEGNFEALSEQDGLFKDMLKASESE